MYLQIYSVSVFLLLPSDSVIDQTASRFYQLIFNLQRVRVLASGSMVHGNRLSTYRGAACAGASEVGGGVKGLKPSGHGVT